MFKRSVFTNISPLPPTVSRETALDFLHDHLEMIDLNPLIKERHIIDPPDYAEAEERKCVWYSLTDKISYLPGGVMSGDVTYTCAFHDLPFGIQTHCYAPMGLDIRDKWSVCGTLPGEPPEPVELGLAAPASGLYIREDIEMKCNILMAGFVKKTLQKAHGVLVDTLAAKAALVSRRKGSPLPLSSSQASHPPQHSHNPSWQSSHSRPHSGSNSPSHAHSLSTSHSRLPSQSSSLQSSHARQHSSSYAGLPEETAPTSYQGPVPKGQQSWHSPPPPPPPAKDEQPDTLGHALQQDASTATWKSSEFPTRSDTVYHGPSKPQDYAQFGSLNPFSEPSTTSQDASASRTYRPYTRLDPTPPLYPKNHAQKQLAAELE
ncbi:hypothetical protein S40293_08861 [Stachybotrys chartarum IBT 40293]|nr:hypothetical protein S40293_08861 [Stachybotrys chartarum IBT 40293]